MAITGLILAGGRGTRMGNLDKGLQSFHGAPMALQVMRRLAPQVDQIMINANRNLTAYQTFCSTVWPDDMQGFAGPLAGLQTGLMHCRTTHLASVPCDSPFLPIDLIDRLHAALTEHDADLAVAVTGPDHQAQPQPVFCLMKSLLLPHLTRFLQHGGRKIDAWHASLSVAKVHFEDETAFCNINTLDELRQF